MGVSGGAPAGLLASVSGKRTYGSAPGFVTKAKKGVDGLNSPPYMPLHSGGDGPLGSVFASRLFQSDHRRPEPSGPGRETRRLFDIVGLDEGTCGRRLGHLEPLGSG